MALLAAGPLRHLPEMAARLPGTLRDLGERVTAIPGARRRAPALAFAAQALAGSVRNGATLRERYLEPAGGGDGRRHLGARPPGVPRRAAPADRRTRSASSACSSTTVPTRC